MLPGKRYKPEELFDESGKLIAELAELAPTGERRMGANPHANGGLLLKGLKIPDFRSYKVDVPNPGVIEGEATRVMGEFLRAVGRLVDRIPDISPRAALAQLRRDRAAVS